MISEFEHKLKQVRSLLKSAGTEAALIARQTNFSWLTCGGEAHVALNSERATGQLIVTPKKVFLLANCIEMLRLQNEEVRKLGLEPLVYDWENAAAARALFEKVANPKKVISDMGDWDSRAVPELFAPLRYSLYPEEVKRLLNLGRAAEAAMVSACRTIQPGMSEYTLAGCLAEKCWQTNLAPVVILIAVDERTRQYRHPLPTTKKLKRHAMLVLCARQRGLIVSITRLVHFGKLSAELKRRHEAVCKVDAAFIGNTKVGAPVREIFNRGIETYAIQGFSKEWRLHHQGGPCGYQTREYLGTSTTNGIVLENQAFAWNPSITGTKSEDTILATTKGPEILTASHDWPMLRIQHENQFYLRPNILER